MYQINEGRFVVPQGATDKSTTLLSWPDGQGETSLAIVRDRREKGEDIGGYVTRQLAELKKHLKGYTLLNRQDVLLGSGEQALAGEQLESRHYASNRLAIYQRQAGFIISDRQVLVLTLTRSVPFDETTEQYWQTLLSQFELRVKA